LTSSTYRMPRLALASSPGSNALTPGVNKMQGVAPAAAEGTSGAEPRGGARGAGPDRARLGAGAIRC
jgi:hypothetical protein